MEESIRHLTLPSQFFRLFFSMASGAVAMSSGKARRNMPPEFSERIALVVRGNPSDDAYKRITDEYGEEKARLINKNIALVYFGNMCSNTVYAFQTWQMKKNSGLKQRITYMLCLPIGMAIRKAGSIIKYTTG